MTNKIFNMLWHTDYYDGPLAGVAQRIEDQKYVWFDCILDEDDYVDRKFNVYLLTDEQYQQLLEIHRTFQTCVGYNCDYGEVYQPFTLKDKEKFDWYYKTKDERPTPTINKEQLIGIFEEGEFKREKR